MSRSTMYCVRQDGFVAPYLYLQNSNGTGPVVWTTLVERYGLRPLPGKWDPWETLFQVVEDGSLKLEWWEHNTLWWTYDYAMLRREDFQAMADSFRIFAERQKQDRISHGPEMAEALERMLMFEPDILAACIRVTDLSDNLWVSYNPETDERDLNYNLHTGNKHQYIEVRRP